MEFRQINGFDKRISGAKTTDADVGPLLRAALTGMKQSPSIVHIMLLLGRSETSNGLGLLATTAICKVGKALYAAAPSTRGGFTRLNN